MNTVDASGNYYLTNYNYNVEFTKNFKHCLQFLKQTNNFIIEISRFSYFFVSSVRRSSAISLRIRVRSPHSPVAGPTWSKAELADKPRGVLFPDQTSIRITSLITSRPTAWQIHARIATRTNSCQLKHLIPTIRPSSVAVSPFPSTTETTTILMPRRSSLTTAINGSYRSVRS